MPKRVYCNIEKHRILDNNKEIEDVTKFGLPTIAIRPRKSRAAAWRWTFPCRTPRI